MGDAGAGIKNALQSAAGAVFGSATAAEAAKTEYINAAEKGFFAVFDQPDLHYSKTEGQPNKYNWSIWAAEMALVLYPLDKTSVPKEYQEDYGDKPRSWHCAVIIRDGHRGMPVLTIATEPNYMTPRDRQQTVCQGITLQKLTSSQTNTPKVVAEGNTTNPIYSRVAWTLFGFAVEYSIGAGLLWAANIAKRQYAIAEAKKNILTSPVAAAAAYSGNERAIDEFVPVTGEVSETNKIMLSHASKIGQRLGSGVTAAVLNPTGKQYSKTQQELNRASRNKNPDRAAAAEEAHKAQEKDPTPPLQNQVTKGNSSRMEAAFTQTALLASMAFAWGRYQMLDKVNLTGYETSCVTLQQTQNMLAQRAQVADPKESWDKKISAIVDSASSTQLALASLLALFNPENGKMCAPMQVLQGGAGIGDVPEAGYDPSRIESTSVAINAMPSERKPPYNPERNYFTIYNFPQPLHAVTVEFNEDETAVRLSTRELIEDMCEHAYTHSTRFSTDDTFKCNKENQHDVFGVAALFERIPTFPFNTLSRISPDATLYEDSTHRWTPQTAASVFVKVANEIYTKIHDNDQKQTTPFKLAYSKNGLADNWVDGELLRYQRAISAVTSGYVTLHQYKPR